MPVSEEATQMKRIRENEECWQATFDISVFFFFSGQ